MVLRSPGGGGRVRILAGTALTAVALIGAMAVPGGASAATTPAAASPATDTGSLVTLRGTTAQDPSSGCITLVTANGSSYELRLPARPTPDQRDLILNGIPLDEPVEVQAKPLADAVSHCMVGPIMEVESMTELVALTGTTEQFPSAGCITLFADDGATHELRLPENPTSDQRDLILNGIPLDARVEVLAKPLTGVASSCNIGPVVEVESLTVIIANLTVTVDGIAQQFPSPDCTMLVANDGSTYELQLPAGSTGSAAGGSSFPASIPLGVPIEVTGTKPTTRVASFCMVGPILQVQALTVLS